MAFKATSLALVNSTPTGANKTVNWYNYATPDAAATVIAAGYFNTPKNDKLRVNDVINAMCVSDGVGDLVQVIVTANPGPGGNITVAINGEAAGT